MINDRLERQQDEVRNFIRLQLGATVARSASHIRSKRAATLRAGIDEVRYEYAADHGVGGVFAFLECVQAWLVERGSTVAAAALHAYLEIEKPELRAQAQSHADDFFQAQADMIDSNGSLRPEAGDGHVEAYGLVALSDASEVTSTAQHTARHGIKHAADRAAIRAADRMSMVPLATSVSSATSLSSSSSPAVAGRISSPPASRVRRIVGTSRTTHSYRSSRSR